MPLSQREQRARRTQQERDRREANREQENEARRLRRDYESEHYVRAEEQNARHAQRQRQSRHEHRSTMVLDDEAFVVTEEQFKEILDICKDDAKNKRDKSKSFFWDANSSPLKALLLYQMNSGCHRFDEWKQFCARHAGEPVDIEALKAELQEEVLTNKELQELIENFQNACPRNPETLYACAGCGLRHYEEKYTCNEIPSPATEIHKYKEDDANTFKNNLKAGDENPVTIYTGPDPINDAVQINPWRAKSFHVCQNGDWATRCEMLAKHP